MFQLPMNARMPDGHDAGQRQREHHPEEEAEPAGAVDRGGLLDLVGDGPQERHQDDDGRRQAEGDLRDDHAEQVVDQAEVLDRRCTAG